MKYPAAFVTVLAGVAIGCAPTTTPTDGGSAKKPDDTKVVQGGPGADPTGIQQPETTPPKTEDAPKTETQSTQQGAAAAPPQQGGAQAGGGERQGGGGGGRGGRGFGLAFLINNDQIKKELNITEEQAKKIEAAMPQRSEGGQGGGQQMSQEERQKQREEIEAKVKEILTPAQEARIQEIMYQVAGPRALTQPDVVKALGLSDDQVKKIEEALAPPPRTEGGQTPGGGQGGFDREAFMKQREEASKKALAVLTASQKAKWEKMQGKKFELQRSGGNGNATPR